MMSDFRFVISGSSVSVTYLKSVVLERLQR